MKLKRIGVDRENQGDDFKAGEEYSAPEEPQPKQEDGDANAPDA